MPSPTRQLVTTIQTWTTQSRPSVDPSTAPNKWLISQITNAWNTHTYINLADLRYAFNERYGNWLSPMFFKERLCDLSRVVEKDKEKWFFLQYYLGSEASLMEDVYTAGKRLDRGARIVKWMETVHGVGIGAGDVIEMERERELITHLERKEEGH